MFMNLYLISLTKLRKLLWLRMIFRFQLQFLYHLCRDNIFTTSPVNNDITHLALRSTPRMEDIVTKPIIVFYMGCTQAPTNNQRFRLISIDNFIFVVYPSIIYWLTQIFFPIAYIFLHKRHNFTVRTIRSNMNNTLAFKTLTTSRRIGTFRNCC